MQNEVAARLIDGRGKLKSFDRWKEDVRGITNHFVGSWLRTEYNTAVIRAHQAADWQHFIDEADVYPNVRWMPTTSPNQDPLHRQYWESKLTLPVNHPFWDEHHPGERWNCKCMLKQTDEPANDSVIKDFYQVAPQKGLENNPGKDGSLFSDSHSYFPKSCSSCEFYRAANKGLTDRIGLLFRNRKKDCYMCEIISESMGQRGITEEIKKLSSLKGKDYWEQLKAITQRKDFKRIEDGIYSATSDKDPDYRNILNAARICVKGGYKAYLMPNPKSLRTADIILERKNCYKLYDIKTITGRNSVSSRLNESVGQTNNVLLNITSRYNPRRLSDEIKKYFNDYTDANEVIICYRGRVRLNISRAFVNKDLWKYLADTIR